MESPTILLSSAAFESEEQSRTLRVIRACKIITDVLPFDKKNLILLEETELMKNLMLCFPLNPRAIDLIVYSMIEKFQSLHTFLKEMWMGFLFVANLDESEPALTKRLDNSSKNFQLGIKKFGGDLDGSRPNSTTTTRGVAYCKQIERSKELIKLATLNFADKLIEIYLRRLRDKVAFKPDIPLLLKTFLNHSPSEKVIIKTCHILEKVKRKDSKIPFDNEVEEILLSKKAMISDLFPQSRISLDASQAATHRLKPNKGGTVILRSPTNNNIGSAGSERAVSRTNLKAANTESPIKVPTKLDIASKISIEESDESDQLDAEVQQSELEMLDEWLCENEIQDVPIIAKNEDIMEIILKPSNLEIFLGFVLDPRSHPISDSWMKRHGSQISLYREEDNLASRSADASSLNLKLQKMKDTRSLHPFTLRSFKVMQVMCDLRNFKYIMQAHKEGLEMFFSNMYSFCSARPEGNMCNYNHIARITEYFFRKDAHGTSHFLIRYNLMFKFLENMGFQYVQHLFLTLFGCSEHVRDLDPAPISLIMKYCKLTSFFSDLANAILLGEKTLDAKKCEFEYKPIGIGPLLKGPAENSFFFTIDERPTSYAINLEEPYLVEEFKGFNLDIDGLQEAFKAKKTFDLRKLKTLKNYHQSNKSLSPVAKRESLRRYPSLAEKNNYNILSLDISKSNNYGARRSSDALQTKTKHKNSRSSAFVVEASGVSSLDGKIKLPNLTDEKNSMTLDGESQNGSKVIQKKLQNFILQTPSTATNTVSRASNTSSPNGPFSFSKTDKKINLPNIETILEDTNTQERDSIVNNNILSGKRNTSEENSGRGTQTSMLKRGDTGTSFDRIKSPSGDSFRRYTRESASELRSPSKLKGEINNQNDLNKEPKVPQKLSIINELKTDTIGTNGLKLLNMLYPLSCRDMMAGDIDLEAKRPEFAVESLKSKENFSLTACEFLEELFRKAFIVFQIQDSGDRQGNDENQEEKKKKERQHLLKNLGATNIDHTELWDTILEDECKFFELLLKNYLIKIKMSALGMINSGFTAGKIVNMILEKCAQKNPYVEKHSGHILNICKKHFHYLCKMVIQSHAWEPKEDIKVFLQDHEVTDLLGSGRLLLVTTLNLIVQNDHSSNYSILYQINDTCWHTMIIWFFTKRTNNIYQQLFFRLFETALLHANEKYILNLLFKLDIITNMYNLWSSMCQNNVMLKEFHINSMVLYIKKIADLVLTTAEDHENYRSLRSQLITSVSWQALEPKLIQRKRKNLSLVPTKMRSGGHRNSKSSLPPSTPALSKHRTSITQFVTNELTSPGLTPKYSPIKIFSPPSLPLSAKNKSLSVRVSEK